MLRAFMMALVLTVALAATVGARTVKVPERLGAVIPSAAAIGVPVLLPATIDLDYAAGKPIYGEATSVKKDHYALSLSAAQGCDGANACFLAELFGTRGAKLGVQVDERRAGAGAEGPLPAEPLRRLLRAGLDLLDPEGRPLRDRGQRAGRQGGVRPLGQLRDPRRQPRLARQGQQLGVQRRVGGGEQGR
jgi:hypothetical protein